MHIQRKEDRERKTRQRKDRLEDTGRLFRRGQSDKYHQATEILVKMGNARHQTLLGHSGHLRIKSCMPCSH